MAPRKRTISWLILGIIFIYVVLFSEIYIRYSRKLDLQLHSINMQLRLNTEAIQQLNKKCAVIKHVEY